MIDVDKIVTISLKENHARQNQTQKELEKLQLKTDFFFAQRDEGHEERGCFHSHSRVCKQALDEHCRSILVFEDDVKILPFQQKQIEQINTFIEKKSSHFDLLYLGLIIGKMWFCGYRSIVRSKGSGAHAYILSQRGMETLAHYEYDGQPIDKIMKHHLKCYSVFPIIAEQHPVTLFKSDIACSRFTDEIKDELFWKNNYRKQKWLLWKYFYKSLGSLLT